MALLTPVLAHHIVLTGPERRDGIVAALAEAGIASEPVAGATVERLDPLGACGGDGWVLVYRNGSEAAVAGVVLLSPPPRLPWLDPALLDWDDGRPALVGGILAPGLANIYLLGEPAAGLRGGGVPLLAAMICTQQRLLNPLVDALVTVARPSREPPSPRVARRVERRLQRQLGSVGSRARSAAVRDFDAALSGVRAT